MPVYNDGPEVEKAILSILDQDWPSIEVIAVNDGSTDSSKQVLNKLKKDHKNLTVLHFDNNKGACVARNEGAKLAKGKYFAWLPADAKLYPGMARIWVETLERNPDKAFLYGGYKFVDDKGNTVINYYGDDFFPYMLEVNNYIDGSFPIRSEVYWEVAKIMNQPDGLWDPNIKSLQDWDFWLSVVKEGKKEGIYAKDIFFETTMPHPGGLSHDSHNNWLARTNAIKIKHGIPLRKICVVSPGAPFFGKYIAKILDADFKPVQMLMKGHDYDMIYMLGYYTFPAQIMEETALAFVNPKLVWNLNEFIKQGKQVPLANAVKVVHLIGTDVLQMQYMNKFDLAVMKHYLNGVYDHTFTEFKPTHKEMKDLGIETEVLPLPPRKFFEANPFPKKFTVAVYAPPVNSTLYNVDLMEKLADALPNIEFKFFGNMMKNGRENNKEYVGYVYDMQKFIDSCSCLMRITNHDGLPQAVLEFLSAGRRVIFNHDFKYVNTANHQIALEPLIKAIKEESKESLNLEASKWIRNNFNQEKFKEKIYSLLTYDPKHYWESEADRWAQLVAKFYGTKDWDEIKPFIDDLKPKSVIDIGCGEGQWSDKFEIDYLGVDISEKLVKYAEKRHPDKRFIASSLEDVKLGKKYDLAFVYTTFMGIPEQNMEKAVKSLKKLARKAILVEPTDIETKYYQHNHDYSKWFNIVKEKQIGPRKLMVVDLSRS